MTTAPNPTVRLGVTEPHATPEPSPVVEPAAEPAPRTDGRRGGRWWERRAQIRRLVGGCPDHWWNQTAPRTAACTCDR